MAETPSRRNFLKQAGVAFGGGWLALNASLVLAAAERAAARHGEQSPWRTLNPSEVRTLEALADQVYPPDDTPEFSAGATQLGAVRFMDEAFAGFMASALGPVREGLADLDRRAGGVDGAGFAGLPFDAQTGILHEVEDMPFFATVHFLTLCGVFAMPSYGGNRDGEGWKQIGFDRRHVWHPPFGHYDALAAQEGDDERA